MKKSIKKGFTLFELIFVIVIIGILAIIAIPKLVATRDDARVSTMMMNIGNIISEITTYATSKKETTSNLANMSNTLSKLVIRDEANCSIDNVAIIKMGGVNCIKMTVVKTASDNDLNVSTISTSNMLCKYLQKEIKPNLYQVRLRGIFVKY